MVQLIGGLGNQLFQYAAGRAIALRHGVELLLDLSSFETYKLHAFSLQHFGIRANVASDGQLRAMGVRLPRPGEQRLDRRVLRRLARARVQRLKERSLAYDPEIAAAGPHAYLEGYLASPRYFSHVEHVIRREVRVTTPPSEENHRVAGEIADAPAVCVHVRRADYVENATTKDIHGVCSPAYYDRAASLMLEREPNARFFVFSDDIPWCEENLELPGPTTFVGHNDAATNYEDLRLMSCCRHFIIANSTFSWWGAWLGTHPAKTVVAPRQWFRTAERSSEDLVPDEWVRL